MEHLPSAHPGLRRTTPPLPTFPMALDDRNTSPPSYLSQGPDDGDLFVLAVLGEHAQVEAGPHPALELNDDKGVVQNVRDLAAGGLAAGGLACRRARIAGIPG